MKRAREKSVYVGIIMTLSVLFLLDPALAKQGGRSQEDVGQLTGTVTIAGTTTVVAHATVAATGSAGTYVGVSDSEGTYTILPPVGDYSVTVSAEGFISQTLHSTVKDSGKSILNFSLSEAVATTGLLAGVVTDAITGVPLAGAMVSTTTGGYTSVTNLKGEYSIEMIASDYQVTAHLAGYDTYTQDASIVVAQTTTTDFALTPSTSGLGISSISATPETFLEASTDVIFLNAVIDGDFLDYQWHQVAGPKVPLASLSATSAQASVANLEIAAECDLVFELRVRGGSAESSARVKVAVHPADVVQYPGLNVQIGGSSNAVARFEYGGAKWCLFNIGTALKAMPVNLQPSAAYEVILPAFAMDIEIIDYAGTLYALVAAGEAGVVIVDISNPMEMSVVSSLPINYRLDNVTFTETGGSILYGNTFESKASPIVALVSDGADLYIANKDFGIHKTSLFNVFGSVLENDGTLQIDQEICTVQYAGEHAWGGPEDLTLFGGKLFTGLGTLGMGIFDQEALVQVGRYNLYTDESHIEDFFGAMAISQAVASDPETGKPFLDEFTGMPDYRQVNFEITQVMKGSSPDAPTPWADMERKGKWYYEAAGIDVAQQGDRTIAYIAYSLGGVIAVDVTGFETASQGQWLEAPFLGFFPAVPANGPYETGSSPSSLLPYEGAGKLKEAGTTDVEVRGDRVFLTDHFAGLVILNNAAQPEAWQGDAPPYDNDTDGIPNNNVPKFEDIVSYDMGPWNPADNESLPWAYYQAPCELATRELNGHGYSLQLMDELDVNSAGQVDVLECSSGGGFVYVDITNLSADSMAERFSITTYVPTTDEIGAAPDGSASQTIALGHTDSISSTAEHIYVSDGPHGISAWKITDDQGYPTDEVHLVANTLQDEYPVEVNGELIYPASHTVRNVVGPDAQFVWSACSGNGLRRIPIAEVEAGFGKVSAPLLMKLHLEDSFEHNADWGVVKQFNYQDHAYDVEFLGDLAFVADGSNGLTIYDISKDPTHPQSGFFVGNIGKVKSQPLLGTASGVELWQNPATNKRYAVIAAGPYGVGVVDVTDINAMQVVKVFEPIKFENDELGSADGQAIDVEVIGDKAYFTYDSFGVLCYAMSDLIAPVPEGVDPTDLFKKTSGGTAVYDYRPEFLGRFKLQYVPGYEDISGGAVKMDYVSQNDQLFLYVAFGEAGVIKIDYSDPANPTLVERINTAGECTAVEIANGRLYVGDHGGGLVLFK